MSVVVANLPQEHIKEIKVGVHSLTDALSRIQEEREFMKETLEELEDKYGIEKKVMRKIARTLFKASFSQDKQENETFEEVYEALVLNA